jgi:hypothetical protein
MKGPNNKPSSSRRQIYGSVDWMAVPVASKSSIRAITNIPVME